MSADPAPITTSPPRPTEPVILPLGRDGWLVSFHLTMEPWVPDAVQMLVARASANPPTGVTGVSPCLGSVLFTYDPDASDRMTVRAGIAEILRNTDWRGATPIPAPTVWHLPTAFGGDHGPDLNAVAGLTGLGPDAVVRMITDTPLRVLAIGFAPGQPYLGLLPEALNLPRMSEINPQVPYGAIALAISQLVLFANPSPTGWRQVARTAFRPYQPDAPAPLPLSAGDEVRLIPVGAGEMDALLSSGDPMGGARQEVRG